MLRVGSNAEVFATEFYQREIQGKEESTANVSLFISLSVCIWIVRCFRIIGRWLCK